LGLNNWPASGNSLLSRVVPRTPAPELAVNTGLAHKTFAALTIKSFLACGCICTRASTFWDTPVAKTLENGHKKFSGKCMSVPSLKRLVTEGLVKKLEGVAEDIGLFCLSQTLSARARSFRGRLRTVSGCGGNGRVMSHVQ
jgi:hypothetical protein